MSKPIAELLDDNRLIIWDIKQAREIYNNGFYGKPLGDPRPREDFENPLLLDPVEAQYLLEHKTIKIHRGKTSLERVGRCDLCRLSMNDEGHAYHAQKPDCSGIDRGDFSVSAATVSRP